MDPMPGEKLNYEEEEPQKNQNNGSGAISALADDELVDDDDEYDELYGDVNVGEGFLQLQLSETPGCPGLYVNGGSPTPTTTAPEPRPNFEAIDTSQKEIGPDVSHDAQALNSGYRGSTPVAQNNDIDPVDMLGKVVNEFVPLLNPKTSVQQAVSQMPPNPSKDYVNMNRQFADVNPIRPTRDNGPTILFVGELNWWTTDAEINSVSSKYGRVKEVEFFYDKVSGKSKGCCKVEFYDSAAAAACKEGMNGYIFNGRACTVAFASPHTIRLMGDSYMNKSRVQPQAEPHGRRLLNNNAGRRGSTNYRTRDSGSGYGRGGWARGQGGGNRGDWHTRGIGAFMGPNNMPNIPGGFMHPHGMMAPGFDSTYIGRCLQYPVFPEMLPPFWNVNALEISGLPPPFNPAFFGMARPADGMRMMGNAGMDGPNSGLWSDTNTGRWGPEERSQRTRESSFGGEDGGSEYGYSSNDKGPKSNAISSGREQGSERNWSNNSGKRPHDKSDNDQKMYYREHLSDKRPHDESDNDRMLYYGEHGSDKRPRDESDHDSNDSKRYDRNHRSDKRPSDESNRRMSDQEHRYREHWQKDRYLAYKDDWDHGQISARSRSRSSIMVEDHRSHSRDADYGKRRRLPSH